MCPLEGTFLTPPPLKVNHLNFPSQAPLQEKCRFLSTFLNLFQLVGVFGDYSEQQLVDCGYGYEGANACRGAGTMFDK